MTNRSLLKNSIETLKGLRVELHDKIDSGIRKKLNQIIQDLESCDEHRISPQQILDLFGKGLALIPLIEKLMEKFK